MKQGTARKGNDHYITLPAPFGIEPDTIKNLINIHGSPIEKLNPLIARQELQQFLRYLPPSPL